MTIFLKPLRTIHFKTMFLCVKNCIPIKKSVFVRVFAIANRYNLRLNSSQSSRTDVET